MKMLQIDMPDGSVWQVPAVLVAEHRAAYYAEKDTGSTEGKAYERSLAEELEIALGDADELIDWGANNMDWTDVSDKATMVSGPPAVDFQEGWCNGEKHVVDVPDPAPEV